MQPSQAQAIITQEQQQIFTAGDGQNQYLTFTLGDEIYGIGILYIKEILEYGNLTPVPMVPPFIRGVLNLRGNVLPVIDLTVRLGIREQPGPVDRHTCIVIVEVTAEEETVSLGIVVDAVNDVLTLDHEDLETAPSFGSHVRADFIRNIGKTGDGFIILLDVDKTLSLAELSALE